MLEESLYFVSSYSKWVEDEGFAIYSAELFSGMVLSYALARAQGVPPWKVIGEHVVIGLCVVAITHYLGDWVRETFG